MGRGLSQERSQEQAPVEFQVLLLVWSQVLLQEMSRLCLVAVVRLHQEGSWVHRRQVVFLVG